MDAILDALSSRTWVTLVYCLLHSLWLGVAWAAVLGFALRTAGNNPEKRYRLALASLGGLLFSILLVGSVQDAAEMRGKPPVVRSATVTAAIPVPSTAAASVEIRPMPRGEAPAERHGSWIAASALLWLTGFLVMCVRLVVQLLGSGRVQRTSHVVSDLTILTRIRELREKLGMERLVQVVSNATMVVPSAVGIFSPIILLPASMLSGFPPEQLRAILLHELAHIRRHDYLVDLLQQVAEALLFFNPAVWWINRQIRLEREACCDAIAVRASAAPKDYAAALTDFARHVYDLGHHLQPAFPGDRQPSTLLERIRRLLVAEYQPAVRVPWYSFCSVLLCTGLVLFGAWRGTKFAVSMAAEILSPEQRMERIAQLQAAAGQEERTYTEADNIKIEGQIRTADGAPLPDGLQLHIHVSNRHESFGSGPLPLENGHFQHEIRYGEVHLAAWGTKDYGPAFVGPLRTRPGGAITNLSLVLAKGFRGLIRVRDSKDQPLAGVELEGAYQFPTGTMPLRLFTDSNGEAITEHCIGAPMRWSANLNGFQNSVRADVRLRANEPLVWQLQPARVTSGQVVRRTDRKPVAGARISLLYRSGGSVSGDLNFAPILARTDEHGMFELKALPDQATHIIAVEAAGFATQLVREVTAGQKPLLVELGPEIFIEGRIEGDLSQLRRIPESVIYVANPIHIDSSHTHNFNRTILVDITGETARFAVSNLWEGEVVITAGERTFGYNLKEPKRDLVLHLPQTHGPADDVAIRDVIVQFRVPAGAPTVKGRLEVTRRSETNPNSTRTWVGIEENEARFTAPVKGWVSWSNKGLIGYWTPEHMGTQVPEGATPLVIEAQALAAGAIHGAIRDSDGSEIAGVMISVVEAQSAPGKPPGSLGEIGKNSATPNDGPTRFVAQPLPLGGEYVLIAHRGNQFAASDVLAITTNEPIREIELRLVPGEELSGVVTDTTGTPLARVPVSLNYDTPYGHSFGIAGFGNSEGPVTDAHGRFSIKGLNGSLPGHYTLIVDQQRGFQGTKQEVDWGKSVRITLVSGEKLGGIVLNDLTANVVEGAEFYVLPEQFRIGDTYVNADARSDSKGHFEFTRLAKREYKLCCREGEIVSPSDLRVRPSQEQTMIIRIRPHPGARLWERGELVSTASK
jgi:beta-lactamase regulating signal transducer with metallopeptidase domain